MSAPAISVIIVAYRSGPTLARCLAALKAQTFTGFETLLVDNGGDDEAVRAAAADPSIRLISPGENLGFAAGNNLAAAQAAGRWLVLLNPDAFAQADWLAALADAADRWPACRAFTSRQLMDGEDGVLDGMGDVMFAAGIPYRGGYGQADAGGWIEGEVFSPCGAAMMIDRALFLGLGGFDESFFCYCEDVDLGFRLQLAAEPVLVIPGAVVRHEGSASSGGPASDFAVYHGTRNRLWMLIKDLPWPLLVPVLGAHFMAVGMQLFLARRDPVAARTGKALLTGLRTWRTPWKSRRAVQQRRRASWLAIARAMTWRPGSLLTMRPDIRTPRSGLMKGVKRLSARNPL
jgi:N-acetylglucosaminyl-diphospho-decaprenol L-rhamnosyltransferase